MANADSSTFTQLKDLLLYLPTVKGDLSNITAPPFILAPKSAIETPSCWACHTKLFLQPAEEPDVEKRALLVVKNYLCSLKQLVSGDSDNEIKKPLNPFLGEIFLGQFEDGDSVTKLVAEQVSHHPPVTACSIYNAEYGISSHGFVAQETSFSPTSGVTVRQMGYAVVRDERHGEKHLMTMPTLLVKGLATGKPYPALEGSAYISSSSGYITEIRFEAGSKLGFGSKNRVTAEVFGTQVGKRLLFTIKGSWDGRLTVKNEQGKTVEEFDVRKIPVTRLYVRPLDKQTPWESRRAWRHVIEGIKEANVGKIMKFKSSIEESQRRRREEERKYGTEWNSMFFERSTSEDDEEVKQLLKNIPDLQQFSFAQTDGAWSFIGIEEAEGTIRDLSRGHGDGPDRLYDDGRNGQYAERPNVQFTDGPNGGFADQPRG